METQNLIQQRDCQVCKLPFPSNAVVILGREIFRATICEPCQAERQAEHAAKRDSEKASARELVWHSVCPATYRDTNPTDPRLNRALVAKALAWCPSSRGIGFIGPSDRGKTRSLFLALRKAHDAGRHAMAISHNRFSKVVIDAFSGGDDDRARGKKTLLDLSRCDALLIDDLGKAPSTERCDAELEELVEVRTSEGLPILWSANGSGEWLINRFGADRGKPLVRRLAEFCDVESVK